MRNFEGSLSAVMPLDTKRIWGCSVTKKKFLPLISLSFTPLPVVTLAASISRTSAASVNLSARHFQIGFPRMKNARHFRKCRAGVEFNQAIGFHHVARGIVVAPRVQRARRQDQENPRAQRPDCADASKHLCHLPLRNTPLAVNSFRLANFRGSANCCPADCETCEVMPWHNTSILTQKRALDFPLRGRRASGLVPGAALDLWHRESLRNTARVACRRFESGARLRKRHKRPSPDRVWWPCR